MLIKVCSLVGRNRPAVLLLSLALAAGLGLLRQSAADRDLVFVTGTVVILGAFVLALVALRGYHPVALRVRPEAPSFETLPAAGMTLLFAAFTVQGGTSVSGLLGGDLFDTVLIAVWATALTLGWCLVFRAGGVRLTPDGVEDRQPFGSIVIPWEAFTGVPNPAYVTGRDKVSLMFSRAGLIRRRGWRPIGPALPAVSIDARFLSYAVHEYAHRPEIRAAIGTETEYTRLVREFPG
ncbi:hypothetical protein [Actinoplanes sp. G11-F43]|uniref:hypothetical protein n=1 Tax=Actinoplanes sp. G11-F43 TaxID=3424130 RepID=UPI003D3373E9